MTTRQAEDLTGRLVALRPWTPLLSPRKRQLAEMRAQGIATAQIAAQLGLAVSGTVVAIAQARQRLEILRSRYPDPNNLPARAPRETPGPKLGSRHRAEAESPPPVVEDDTPTQPEVARIRSRLKVIDGRVRAKTIAPRRLSQDERRLAEDVGYPDDVDRPATRGACSEAPRPCPFVSCRYHLYLDVDQSNGGLKLNFPHLEVWEMAESCALDVADRGGVTLETVGALINVTRERIRQVEVRALSGVRCAGGDGLLEH